MDIKVIAFDADDTLWINEPYFQDYLPQHTANQELYSAAFIFQKMNNIHTNPEEAGIV